MFLMGEAVLFNLLNKWQLEEFHNERVLSDMKVCSLFLGILTPGMSA